jgi:hypothetical protein
MLGQEAAKSRKQKRTVKQLHADLTALGYAGSYNRVAAFGREWKAARHRESQTCGRGVFVPLVFLPGEAFQFDWSEDWAIIAGERTKLQVAHVKLAYSRAFMPHAPIRSKRMRCCSMPTTTPCACWAVCRSAASTTIAHGRRQSRALAKERKVNTRSSAMVSHFLFEADFCNPASGWEKGCSTLSTESLMQQFPNS